MKLETKSFEIKSAVASAVQREIMIGQHMLSRYENKLKEFEKRNKKTTDEFLKEFESGKIGDSEEFFEWFSLAKARDHWIEKIEALKKASIAK